MEIFDEIVDFEHHPEVKRAWKLRLFGVAPADNQEVKDTLFYWMTSEKDALEKQSMIFEPIPAHMRKLLLVN